MKKAVLSVALTLSVFGCVNKSIKVPDPVVDKGLSAVDFISQYSSATQAGLFSPYNLGEFVTTHETAFGDVREFNRFWCSNQRNALFKVRASLSEHCRQNGGQLARSWCANGDTPLYKADVQSEGGCTRGEGLRASVVESKTGNDWSYLATYEYGFTSESKRAGIEKSRKDAELFAKQIVAAQKLEKSKKVLASGVGTTICKGRPDGLVYVGYLEAKTDRKIKVLVARLWSPKQRVDVLPFEQKVHWEYPDGWEVCE